MGYGEVCVKKPPCGCFSLKSSSKSREGVIRIRIAANEEQLQSSECFCRVWIEERTVQLGRGQLKFTFKFQSQLHTTPLEIRILKLVPTQDRRLSSKDSIDCRIHVSQRDFRTLQEIEQSFLGKVEKLLHDVQQHQAFASTPDLIKQKLENYTLAIFPDSEGFVLFKEHDGSSRPEHVLLRIRPTTLELWSPRQRPPLSTFSAEKNQPVASLQEALTEFTRSSDWPLVRRGQFGIEWTRDTSKSQLRLETARVDQHWEADDTGPRDTNGHFLDDTVQNLHKEISQQKDKSVMNTIQWKVDSVRSLVRESARISLCEEASLYFAIEKATLSFISNCEAAAVAFVESIAIVIRTEGSESLGVYKLLASTLDNVTVKKAVMQQDVLSTLQEQYELMTQMIAHSSTSASSESNNSFPEAHMEVNKMQCFMYPQIGESESSLLSKPCSSSVSDANHMMAAPQPSSMYHVVQTEPEGTTLSTLSVDLIGSQAKQNLASSHLAMADLQEHEHRQDVPKLTFYWLTYHDGARSTNSATTHTSISLPGGRSIVFDEDLESNEAAQCARDIAAGHSSSFVIGQSTPHRDYLSCQTVAASTLCAWNVPADAEVMEDSDMPVALAIKCTILEIMCAFSCLNLETEICEECSNTRDFMLLHDRFQERDDDDDEELQHPSTLVVSELLVPSWQIFPGEQPSIRWGPTERGMHLAFAVMHEFACRPLNEKDMSFVTDLQNIQQFKPEVQNTKSYRALLAGAHDILAMISECQTIDIRVLEEITAIIHLLGEFVASSPSCAQARLVAYSCLDAFQPLELSVFGAWEIAVWPPTVFRLFHNLLRLFRCMLERATDIVLEEYLVISLLKRESWVKLVREYSRAVLFSEKLEKRCEHEELTCLRCGIWSYHTALVKVVSAQRDSGVQNIENLPQDYQDTCPTSFGHDPLDFLRFLVTPEEGHAPRTLLKRDCERTTSESSLDGGIHALVLVFLKTLFSVPNNAFAKQRDISTYYMELHWSGFKRNYIKAGKRRSYAASVVCRGHLEVIRVLVGHHHVEIFSQAIKLGIMDSLADEIALESARSTTIGPFDPPPSRLKKAAGDAESDPESPNGEASTSNAGHVLLRRRPSNLSTTDADSGLLSSIEFASSEGLNTFASQSIIASSKGSQESWTNVLLQSISFGQREVPQMPPLESRTQQSSPHNVSSSSSSVRKRGSLALRNLRSLIDRKPKSEEIPSRIPLFRQRRSPGSDKKDDWRSNALRTFPTKSETKGLMSSSSVCSNFETRIPCAPSFNTYSLLESEQATNDRPRTTTEPRSFGSGLKSFGSLLGRKSSASLRLRSNPDRNGHMTNSAFVGGMRESRGNIDHHHHHLSKPRSAKAALPGLSPSAELTPFTKTRSAKRANSISNKSIGSSIDTVTGRNPRGGMSATISYSPSGLHVSRLSVEKNVSTTEFPIRQSSRNLLTRTARNVPLLNLNSLNAPTQKAGIGGNQLQFSNRSLSSKTGSKKKRTNSDKLDNENDKPRGLLSHQSSVECDSLCPTPSMTVPSGSRPVRERSAGRNASIDESCDSHGPPTFGIYCGTRTKKRLEMTCEEEPENKNGRKDTSSLLGYRFSNTRTMSSSGTPHSTRFQTPSDFEYTGDVAEDCKRLERLERQYRGRTSTLSTPLSSDSDLDIGFESHVQLRPTVVPLLRMGRQYEDLVEPAVPKASSSYPLQSVEHSTADADEETRQLTQRGFKITTSQPRRLSAQLTQSGESPATTVWLPKRNPSALSGFKTPSDFEYTGDVDEDVKRLEKLERLYNGETPSVSSISDSDGLDSLLEDTELCQSPFFDPLPVPKLNFIKTDCLPCNSKHAGPSGAKISSETTHSASQSQGDELSSFSWMHLSTKESVTESEFAALLNGTASTPGVSMYLSPYEAAREERYVYSDVALRSVWVELLLEGMLLEYNTRPMRDHDTHTMHIERIIKYVPKVLMHHLEQASSKAVVSQLKRKLCFHSPNLYRLLRLLTSSLFPANLYTKQDHVARGTFAHVFRCPFPLEGGPDSCVIKVLDHPVENNEMSCLMDTYSEISIMEQFKTEQCISHLYDYGISPGNIFLVMREYKCSLLEWRKRFSEHAPEALRIFIRIFRDIISAVKVLHEKNVVHFDLKCSNILLEPLPGISEEHFWNPPTEEPPFRVVLADFGEARSYSNNWEARTVRNHGTEFNKSPEMLLIAKAQQTDKPEYDRRKRMGAGPPSDVWALGCLLFELVTGEFLQFDTDWSRFFLRVTTDTMDIIDNEKRRLLACEGLDVVGDLLNFILVRRHLCRPNLTHLNQKLDTIISLDELPPYRRLISNEAFSPSTVQKVPRASMTRFLGTVNLPREEIISFSPILKMARKKCLLNPWMLLENDIALIVCIKGLRPAKTELHAVASRANVELIEISLDDEESVSGGHAEVILNTVSHTRCICFTCEEAFESDMIELILKTLHKQQPSLTLFEHLMNIQRSLKTF